jgi:Uma2 family endonuclease
MYLTGQELDAQMPDATKLLSNEPEMESSLHYMQLLLLVTCLEWLWCDREDFFIGANLTIYYSRQQLRTQDFRGPDFFLVKDVQKHPRNSWVVWEEEGRYPSLIIELLSDSTAPIDRTVKKDLYQDRFHTAEYFWFSPNSLEFEGFRRGTKGYEAIAPNDQGWRWSEELGLYLGIELRQLRYFSITGELIPTPQEAALQARQNAEYERQNAEYERQNAERERQNAERERQRAMEMAVLLQKYQAEFGELPE